MSVTSETPLSAREFDRIGIDGIAAIRFSFIRVTQDGLIRQFSAAR